MIADAKTQGLGGVGGVFHRQRMVDRFTFQPEGAGQHKVERKALGFDLRRGLQPQLDGVPLCFDQSVLQIPGKAVLPAFVGFAFMNQRTAGELAGPGEQDRCVPCPDRRVCLPEHFLSGSIFQADGFSAVGVHRQGQKFVVDGCLHNRYAPLEFYHELHR